ncbi:MAG TPA: tetratricopeptide repeat protein [Longimicrobiaceae bacterium]|nr:tetratricopeptide repeat protein [Longimicrobiaceae bacterium]
MAEVPPELAAEVQKLERYHAENPQGRYFVPLANAYRKSGALEQAEALLREGLRRHPDYLSAHIVLGRCLADRGATEDAVGEFRYVLSVDPQNLIALRSLGEMASAGGRAEEAARWYRELLAVDPMNEDARQALDALESRPAPAAQASAEDSGDSSWWERPADDAADEAGEPAAEEDEVLSWGSVELDATIGTDAAVEGSPAPEPTGALSFGDLELTDAPEEPAAPEEAQPWPGSGSEQGGWDPYAGTTVELQTPAFAGDEDDTPAEPDGDGDEVVTETIAELYARQGFHDRAADVYRELIRRRGGDPALEARLREVERLAAGEGADEPEPLATWTEPATETDELPLLEWSIEEPGLADAGADAEEPEPFVPAAGEGHDPFAASFEAGFGEVSLAPPTAYAPPENTGADLPGFEDETPVPWGGEDSEAAEVAAIFAGGEAFFAAEAPAPAEEPARDEPAAEEDEPLVLASAASELLGDEPVAYEPAAEEEPAGDIFADAGFDADEAFAAGPALEEPAAEAVPAPEVVVEFRSVREYLAGLAAWQPSSREGAGAGAAEAPEAPAGAVAPAEVAPTTMEEVPPAAEHTPAAEFHEAAVEDEEDDMPWLAAPVSEEHGADAAAEPMDIDGLLAAESAGAAASAGPADEEAYPWEAAPAPGEAPAAEPAPEAPPTSAFSFEEFFVEAAEAPAPPPAPEPSAPESPRAETPAQPAASAEDEEDLESFQAWLQSLKR